MLWMQMLPVGMVGTIGERMPRFVREDATPLHSVYPTADGWMAVADHLSAAFPARTTAQWYDALRAAGVWCSPVNRIEELPTDRQVLANEYLATFPDGTVATTTPFEVNGWQGERGVAASYSEHTDEILAELGYSDDERAELRVSGTIW
jgi:crotonobetainyl-CoA:carnitine CoA-transferase CaiB-like acyl-CoA transferase